MLQDTLTRHVRILPRFCRDESARARDVLVTWTHRKARPPAPPPPPARRANAPARRHLPPSRLPLAVEALLCARVVQLESHNHCVRCAHIACAFVRAGAHAARARAGRPATAALALLQSSRGCRPGPSSGAASTAAYAKPLRGRSGALLLAAKVEAPLARGVEEGPVRPP